MKIEVACAKDKSKTDKGNLLELLANDFLSAQNYKVIDQIRFTGIELDLLCKHKVSGKEIYVECKAYRENISANILTNLIGVKTIKNYDEAWLISTGNFGKDAKGICEEWYSKNNNISSSISFYTPDNVIDSLKSSRIIKDIPQESLLNIIKEENLIGEWLLLITNFGRFWAATYLKGGTPSGVILFYANNGKLVEDIDLLTNVSKTDTTLNSLNFLIINDLNTNRISIKEVEVVEVQHADSWNDYRPSRAVDFVGRKNEQDKLFKLFSEIKDKDTKTRVFALTGDSGMGKSSLINQIIDKSRGKKYINNLFIFAVDVRAAKNSNYIFSSILACLKAAQKNGMGDSNCDLRITNVSQPLSSASINTFLESLERNNQVVSLIFDQFEELYSKQTLFGVFEKAGNLFLEATSIQTNFCLGFAWKSDSVTHNEHPAYFMWHKLDDMRMTLKLKPFTDSERNQAFKVFEKEVGTKLQKELKHNILINSQGYPWLLKKLCIHIYDKIKDGSDQKQLVETLDVKLLFENDIQNLNDTSKSCLKLIAQKAPIDAYEINENFGSEVLTHLINQRLVIRSGEKINIYWDIFREYLLSGNVPIIPTYYLPATEFTSVNKIGRLLDHNTAKSIEELAHEAGLTDKTVQNICTDLVMFDIAIRKDSKVLLNKDIKSANSNDFLKMVRGKLIRHAFTQKINKNPQNSFIADDNAISILREVLPSSRFHEKTWKSYTGRLCRWLELCGFLSYDNSNSRTGWTIRDLGQINNLDKTRRGLAKIFMPQTSPAMVNQVLEVLIQEKKILKNCSLPKGYKGALAILGRFGLIDVNKEAYVLNIDPIPETTPPNIICKIANSDKTLIEIIEFFQNKKSINYLEISNYLIEKYSLKWSDGSKIRIGRALKQWVEWIMNSKSTDDASLLPGRINKNC